jgi:hypothetical protein
MKKKRYIILVLIFFGSFLGSCNSSNPKKNNNDSTKTADIADTSKSNPCDKTQLLQVQTVPVYRFNNANVVFFETGMRIDADGSPHAYNPKNTGLDDLKNAGKKGNWWGIATNNDKPEGEPVIQSDTDAAPGYYVSTTSLIDKTKNFKDPKRYVDAEKIPYFVLPPEVMNADDIIIGDIALIYHRKYDSVSFAIFADVGPIDKIGEGSIALANQLHIPSDAKFGGTDKGVIYLIFPHSGNRKPKTISEINDIGTRLFKDWGGMERFKKCFLK